MTGHSLHPSLVQPGFQACSIALLRDLARTMPVPLIKQFVEYGAGSRAWSTDEIEFILHTVLSPPDQINLPSSLVDVAPAHPSIPPHDPFEQLSQHAQNVSIEPLSADDVKDEVPAPSDPAVAALRQRLRSLSPQPSRFTTDPDPKSRRDLEGCTVYAWLRVISTKKRIADAEARKLEATLRNLVATKLTESGFPFGEIVATARTGSAAALINEWSWTLGWSGDMVEMQPLVRAWRMSHDSSTKILVVVGPTGLTANPVSLIPVLTQFALQDGLVVSLEQTGVPFIASAREVLEGLTILTQYVIDSVAPVEAHVADQVASCISAAEHLKKVKNDVAHIPGVTLALRIIVGFLARKAERMLQWWKWTSSLSPDDSSDVRRWLDDFGENPAYWAPSRTTTGADDDHPDDAYDDDDEDTVQQAGPAAAASASAAASVGAQLGAAPKRADLRTQLAPPSDVPRVLDIEKRRCAMCRFTKCHQHKGEPLCAKCRRSVDPDYDGPKIKTTFNLRGAVGTDVPRLGKMAKRKWEEATAAST